MTNDNKDNLKDNQEQEIETKLDEGIINDSKESVESNNDTLTTETEQTSKEVEKTTSHQMVDYLDKSIINIKQYEYDELDNIVQSDSNEDSQIYESGLDKKEKDVVQGTIVRVTDRDVFVDIGFKSEGIISRNEFDENALPDIGEKINVFLE